MILRQMLAVMITVRSSIFQRPDRLVTATACCWNWQIFVPTMLRSRIRPRCGWCWRLTIKGARGLDYRRRDNLERKKGTETLVDNAAIWARSKYLTYWSATNGGAVSIVCGHRYSAKRNLQNSYKWPLNEDRLSCPGSACSVAKK